MGDGKIQILLVGETFRIKGGPQTFGVHNDQSNESIDGGMGGHYFEV